MAMDGLYIRVPPIMPRIVLSIWNDIEAYFDNLEPDEKRNKCSGYGVIYLLRKHEKEPQ